MNMIRNRTNDNHKKTQDTNSKVIIIKKLNNHTKLRQQNENQAKLYFLTLYFCSKVQLHCYGKFHSKLIYRTLKN